MAMPSALVSSAVLGLESIDQPTTRRDHASSTTAQYTLLLCRVLSVGVGPGRSTRLSAGPIELRTDSEDAQDLLQFCVDMDMDHIACPTTTSSARRDRRPIPTSDNGRVSDLRSLDSRRAGPDPRIYSGGER